ncbi:MAG: GTPase Era [Candidatus Paracaedibacteraceae bacterium]|nr:GTPase Era [Candidatus Paracaedibacteraceae bacterium]
MNENVKDVMENLSADLMISNASPNAADRRCGYAAVLGRPNAGKSTLVNKITGHKVSIVSPKVQTTRRRVLGIQIKDDAQIILVDTPGLFVPKRSLEKAIVNEAWQAPKDADLVVYMVDVTGRNHEEDLELIARLPTNIPLYIVFNKVDLVDKAKLFTVAEPFNKLNKAKEFLMISASKGSGVDDLVAKIVSELPKGPWLFDEDQISDAPKKLWASEITREQLYLQLENELPYETFVETEKYEVFDNGSVKISQAIVVARDSQKAIVVGKKGQRIKDISMRARHEMEYYLQQKVHLFLFVKVEEHWMDKQRFLKELFS